MSGIKIGLVTSANEESVQLVKLLTKLQAEICHNITPAQITTEHVEDSEVDVWLLNIDDDSWDDSVDYLLDESETPVYFSEPGSLAKQAHPEFWCKKLLERLFEITGKENAGEADIAANETLAQVESVGTDKALNSQSKNTAQKITESPEASASSSTLDDSLDELALSTTNLPSDIAAELVSELEDISPVLKSDYKAASSSEGKESESNASHRPTQVETVEEQPSETHEDDLSENELATDEFSNFDEEDDIDVDFELEDSSDVEATESDAQSAQTQITDESTNNESLDSDLDEFELALDSLDGDSNDEEYKRRDDSLNSDMDEVELSLDSYEESAKNEDETQVQSDALDSELDDFELALDFFDEQEDEVLDSPASEKERQAELTLDLQDDELKVDAGEVSREAEVSQSEDGLADDNSGLHLEPLESEKKATTGRASYAGNELEEAHEIESEVKKQTQEEDRIEDAGGLTLEPLDTEVDERPEWLSQTSQPEVPEAVPDKIQNPTEPAEPKEGSEAALESAVEEEEQAIGMELEDLQAQDMIETVPLDELHFSDGLELDADTIQQVAEGALDKDEGHAAEESPADIPELIAAEENLDVATEVESSSLESLEQSTDEAEEFEIPMLDETASGMVFEEQETQAKTETKVPCWVIGASLGGPAALKRFMSELPKDINASFIIAQHIDENFLPVLAEILTNNSPFNVTVANGSNEMTSGNVYLAPLNGKTEFLQDGSMLIDRSQKWSGPYSPCINDVIESVSKAYAGLSGAIIFSGMGEDGLNAAKKMRANGGLVWAQSPDTCANASMPGAIIENELADFIGTPEELAKKLVEQVGHSYSNH